MIEDHIGYDKLMDEALREVVIRTLKKVQTEGLISHHHLYITFLTKFKGVEIPENLAQSYPEELTIVIQHQFWGLEVHKDYFSIILSFNKKREKLTVPFSALTRFADPGVKFGLQFTNHELEKTSKDIPDHNEINKKIDEDTNTKKDEDINEEKIQEEENETPSDINRVVSLDSFRKK
ncbi:MAG: hypothetical protein CMM30_00890 [Rhodospirillaceae bacterium]|nr:hypothetical protein [Rhodospirillaceae bacterium]